ncbi:MAG: DNA polymerase III subunit alpha, partial [Lachnospiraceae bacterium]|nr:DNA polymerase III subunit alpha [Lachnospiraceae bacterium]
TAVSLDFIVDEETGEAKVRDGQNVMIGGMITGKMIKITKNNQQMAFLTVEDMAGSVEVLVFPKDYERYREQMVEDAKVFIGGRVSIGDDPQGKLICEKLYPFDSVPRELWLQFEDVTDFRAKEPRMMNYLEESDGNDRVVIWLKKERAKKILPPNWSVCANRELVEALTEKFGAGNVKVVEKSIENR